MNEYFENLNPIIKEYFSILSPKIPDFLYDYIETLEMQRIGKTSMACGTDYSKLYHHQFFYSNLEHSIGVSLIIWHFTKDKKQTLAGLFHDIATPAFKHCIDFLNGDYEKQESTEELTDVIIRESKEITNLLKRDGIQIEEVNDYHIYPIADNDTPMLSSDRLEYTFMNGMFFDSKHIWGLSEIKKFYNHIVILKNEQGIDELGFDDLKIAEEFIHYAKDIWPLWITNKVKLTMQFLADIVKKMGEKNWLTKKDLYTLSEKEVIRRIRNCGDEKIVNTFKLFEEVTEFFESDEPVENKYCIGFKTKRRYVIPLVNINGENRRIDEVSQSAKNDIENYLNWETKKYAYFNF